MLLSSTEKYEIIISTFLFLIFWGFVRNALLNLPIHAKEIFLTTVLYLTWITLSRAISNLALYNNYRYLKKIQPNDGDPVDEPYSQNEWNYRH